LIVEADILDDGDVGGDTSPQAAKFFTFFVLEVAVFGCT
jgi:hypothetical protein